ncbi:MAG: PP2C family protein-serine/threonine phosphatase [Acidimicrobiales bacterium]
MRDLDFGRQLVDYLQQMEWPDGVVVEDLSCAVPLALHRLQELRPAKVVLLGAVPRGVDPPAALRRYRVDGTTPPPAPEDVQRSIEESVTGLPDLDHMLAVCRHWGGLPADTVVIEVEPVEASFGLGFSEGLAACIDPILDLLREELTFEAADLEPLDDGPVKALAVESPVTSPDHGVSELLGYAASHAEARRQRHRGAALVEDLSSDIPGVSLAGRARPWGVFVQSGGDWFDAVPLPGGQLGMVVGDVAGRGVEVAGAMGDLRAALRAYAVLDGHSPASLIGHLDRLAESTGLGGGARLTYAVLDPATGDARFVNAGGCPPLVVGPGAPSGRFVEGGRSGPLGAASGADRREGTLRVPPQSTLLLFTDGLVESRSTPRATGMERLRRAAVGGPWDPEDLCDHVLRECTAELRRDDDISLLGVRLLAAAVASPEASSARSSH